MGNVQGNCFKIWRVAWWNQNFTPVVSGEIQSEDLGCYLEIRMRMPWFGKSNHLGNHSGSPGLGTMEFWRHRADETGAFAEIQMAEKPRGCGAGESRSSEDCSAPCNNNSASRRCFASRSSEVGWETARRDSALLPLNRYLCEYCPCVWPATCFAWGENRNKVGIKLQ